MRESASGRRQGPAIRLLLVLNTLLLICLLLTGYFLLGFGFYTGQETLSGTIRDNLMARQSSTAVYYLSAWMQPNAPFDGSDETDLLLEHFNVENTNFLFAFRYDDPLQSDTKATILTNAESDVFDVCYRVSTEELMQNAQIAQAFRGIPNLTLDCGIRSPMSAHDDFYRVDRIIRLLQSIRYPLLALFLLCAVAEGWLWTRLCAYASDDAADAILSGIHRTPMYLLLALYAFFLFGIVHVLRQQAGILYARAVFVNSDDVRPAVVLSLLLLSLLIWMTTILVSTARIRLLTPQWWKHSVIFHAANIPQSERWILVAAAVEIAWFLLLLLAFRSTDLRLYLLSDLLFMGGLILLIFFRAKNLSGIFRAVHRIAQEGRGSIPTKALHGKALRHAQNIQYLSESAGEQMQRRLLNESFSTELIHSVTRRLRDPLADVIRTVDLLRSGTTDAEQYRRAVARVNRYARELERSIEDLLRIANASAGNVVLHLQPTDAGMMVEQTVGEFYDRFRAKELGLVSQMPDEPVRVPADGACMWTAFEGVLLEFLQCAVPGTRVFLCLTANDGIARFRFRGTSYIRLPDDDIRTASLALPTAKVFTELQNGTFSQTCEQDILTVDLCFPLCGTEEE